MKCLACLLLPLKIALGMLLGVVPLVAQDASEAAPPAAGEKVIPTEISEPPYTVGDLSASIGHIIDDDGFGNKISFRIVDNKIRIYWLDSDNLIIEPPYASGSVRFTGSNPGKAFHSVSRMSGDVGLGAPGILRPPHILNVILALKDPGSEDFKSFAFRYTPAAMRVD